MNKQKELAKIFMIISDARKSVKMKKDISLQFCFDNISFSFFKSSVCAYWEYILFHRCFSLTFLVVCYIYKHGEILCDT